MLLGLRGAIQLALPVTILIASDGQKGVELMSGLLSKLIIEVVAQQRYRKLGVRSKPNEEKVREPETCHN